MSRRCPRCGRPLAGRDPGSLKHAANVRKLLAWYLALPFTAGVAVTLGVAVGLGALR